MAGRGGRVDLSDLAGSVGDTSTVDAPAVCDGVFRANVPLAQLVTNPRNPRGSVGNLEDLATIAERQLQPGTVISRAAWLASWPEDASQLGAAQWVVVNGCRRLAACHHYGRVGMDVVVRDSLAAPHDSILWAAIVENIDRQDFDVLEEARAVELLVAEAGSATIAMERLGRSPGWISQRRALLKLAPELQHALRDGELAVRLARSLAQVPLAQQVEAWRRAQDRERSGNTDDNGSTGPAGPIAATVVVSRALRRAKAQPADVVNAIPLHRGRSRRSNRFTRLATMSSEHTVEGRRRTCGWRRRVREHPALTAGYSERDTSARLGGPIAKVAQFAEL